MSVKVDVTALQRGETETSAVVDLVGALTPLAQEATSRFTKMQNTVTELRAGTRTLVRELSDAEQKLTETLEKLKSARWNAIRSAVDSAEIALQTFVTPPRTWIGNTLAEKIRGRRRDRNAVAHPTPEEALGALEHFTEITASECLTQDMTDCREICIEICIAVTNARGERRRGTKRTR